MRNNRVTTYITNTALHQKWFHGKFNVHYLYTYYLIYICYITPNIFNHLQLFFKKKGKYLLYYEDEFDIFSCSIASQYAKLISHILILVLC